MCRYSDPLFSPYTGHFRRVGSIWSHSLSLVLPLEKSLFLGWYFNFFLPLSVESNSDVEYHLYFLSFFIYLFLKNFYCYSITVVCLFFPSLHPTPAEPTSLPHLRPPPWFCPCDLYSSNPLFPLSPHLSFFLCILRGFLSFLLALSWSLNIYFSCFLP